MKNMAKVLAWASLPETYGKDDDDDAGAHSGDINDKGEKVQLKPSIQKNDYKNTDAKPDRYNSYYFRRVMITVYSTNDMQFRAILHDNVFVSSYEEKYTDNSHDTVWYFEKSKALWPLVIFKAAAVLTGDDVWHVVRDSSMISDYAFL